MPASFRSKDLMINVIPTAVAAGGGTVGLVGPDGDLDDFPTPITPVINVAALSPKFQVFADLGLERLSPQAVSALKEEIGNVALGGLFYCTIDMPTCPGGDWDVISHRATIDFNRADLMVAKERMAEAVAVFDKVEESWFQDAQLEADELIPALEETIEQLRRGR